MTASIVVVNRIQKRTNLFFKTTVYLDAFVSQSSSIRYNSRVRTAVWDSQRPPTVRLQALQSLYSGSTARIAYLKLQSLSQVTL